MYRESQLAIGWDEAFCASYDNISKEDHTHVYSEDEHKRLENSWILQQKSQGPNSPMKQREDYGKERINRSQDPVKHPNELTRKTDGNGIELGRTVIFYFLNPSCKMFRLQAVAIPL